MIKVYRKTATIMAEQFDGSQKMIKKYDIIPAYDKNSENEYWQPVFPCSILMTKKGALSINVGDWVATGINGEHRPISDDIFRKTYAELPVIPRAWTNMIEKYKANHSRMDEIFTKWCLNYDEQEQIARAWLDGYQVEAQHDTRTD